MELGRRLNSLKVWELALATLLLVVLAACSEPTPPPERPTPTPTPPPPTADLSSAAWDTAVVSRGTISGTLELAGRVEALQTVELSFPIAGRLEVLAVSEGDEVEAGDLLAQLDDTELQREAALADLSLQIAQVKLEQARATYNSTATLTLAELGVELARLEVEAARNAQAMAAVDVQRAELAVEAAQYAYRERVAELGSPEAATGSPEDVALRRAQLDLQTLVNKPASTDLRRAQLNLQAAEINYARQEEDLAVAALQLTILEAAVSQAQVAVDRAQAALVDTQLLALQAGRIANLHVSVNQPVAADQPMLTLFDPEGLEVWGTADQSEAAAIQPGQAVTITLIREGASSLRGRVRALEPRPLSGSGERLYRVIVEPEEGSSAVRMGDLAQLTVAVRKEDVLLVPVAAIHQQGGRDYVRVQRDGAWQQVEVELGLQVGGNVEVRGNLQAGETVQRLP